VRRHDAGVVGGIANLCLVARAGLVGGHHGLDPVTRVELGEDPGDVGADRGLAHDQEAGDLGVGKR
jgi:hypothetical protein